MRLLDRRSTWNTDPAQLAHWNCSASVSHHASNPTRSW
jgi:hypothetical protein